MTDRVPARKRLFQGTDDEEEDSKRRHRKTSHSHPKVKMFSRYSDTFEL
jgi:hypothetical protein